jgi:hypothetical protein
MGANRPQVVVEAMMRAVLIVSFALSALTGCQRIPAPQSGGNQAVTLGGAAPSSAVMTAPENAKSSSKQTLTKKTVREFAPWPRVIRAAPPVVIGPQPTARTNAAEPIEVLSDRLQREEITETVTTELGTSHRDTVRDLAARMANMRGVMWAGVALLVIGPVVGWKMGWMTNGIIAGLVGLLLIVLAQVLPGNEAWLGALGLLLIPAVAFIYYRGRADEIAS